MIHNNALKIRDSTPYSFRILAKNLNIFSRENLNQLKFYFEYYRPDKLLTLPIFPAEVIYIAYNNTIECPDENCDKYSKKLEKLTQSKDSDNNFSMSPFINDFLCYFCKRKKTSNEENSILLPKSFVLLDLRLEENCNCGFIPGTVILDKDDFEDQNVKD